jgi:feruloyl esterase
MRMLRRVENNPVSRIGDCYSWVNLNSFSSHGGKLIFYHGVSDPWFSAKDTIDCYQRMTAANGGASKVTEWSPPVFFAGHWVTVRRRQRDPG